MRIKLLFSALIVSLLLLSCSSKPTGQEFIGTWIMRDTGTEITISEKSDHYYYVSGIPELETTYVLNDDGELMDGKGMGVYIRYHKSNDVIFISGGATWPTSTGFDRKKESEATSNWNGNNENTPDGDAALAKLIADSTAAANKLAAGNKTNDFTGRWHTTYGFYAYTMTVNLVISKNGSASCPDYSCNWVSDNGTVGNDGEGSYQWCAQSENGMLTGTADFEAVNNTRIAIYKKDGQPSSIHVVIKNRDNPWELDFTR